MKLAALVGHVLFASSLFAQPVVGGSPSTLTMNPEIEGIYDIRLTCNEPAPKCANFPFKNLDRLSLSDTRTPFGVWASFSSASLGEVIDTFMLAAVGPTDANQISGLPRIGSGFSTGTGRFSFFDLSVDPHSQAVRGRLFDPSTSFAYLISGKKIATVKELLLGAPPAILSVDQVLGHYHGSLGKNVGTLIISKRPDQKLIGYFSTDDKFHGGSSLIFSYMFADWDEKTGVLRLVFLNPGFFAMGEMAMSYRSEVDRKVEFKGFQFTGFANYPVHFVKVD